jgi:hypothetical protein
MERDLFVNIISWANSAVSFYISPRTVENTPEGIPEQEPDFSIEEIRRAISALDTAREKLLQKWHEHHDKVNKTIKKEIKDMTE